MQCQLLFSLCLPKIQIPHYPVLLCDLQQVAWHLCASAIVQGTTAPFLTGRLGGLITKQHV